MRNDLCQYISKIVYSNWTSIIDNEYEYKEQSTKIQFEDSILDFK